MYTLYTKPGSCSTAVHVVLNELNQPVEVINVADLASEEARQKFLQVSPFGQVPTLIDDGHIITEGGAIIAYLLDKHQSPMLPKSNHERATALQWLMFANATMHPAYGRVFFIKKSLPDSPQREQLLKAAIEQINKLWAYVDTQLAIHPHVCGMEISAADILLTVISKWLASETSIVLGDNVARITRGVSERGAYKQAAFVGAQESCSMKTK